MPFLPVTDQLFPHECQVGTMKFSAYNPQGLSYYCTECGGKLVIRMAREEWSQFFDDDSLALNEKVLTRAYQQPPDSE